MSVESIITIAVSAVITTLIGVIMKHYFAKYVDNKDKQDKEYRELREDKLRRERKEDILETVVSAVRPLSDKIDSINAKLDKVEDGTLSTLRNDILTCYYRCVEKGYRNDYDYQNMHHMYESYAELHGNSYVADIIKRFDDDLPTKEEYHHKINKEG